MEIKAFLSVSYSEFCDRVSYYGLSSLLVLYLIHYFHLPVKDSYTVYGTYTALTFACCIIGGVIADKFLTNYQAMLLGISFAIAGNFVLWQSLEVHGIYAGLSLVVVAIGLTKPSTSCILALIFDDKQTSIKDRTFTYFYIVASIGSIAGPFLYGIGIAFNNYRLGFLLCICMLILNACALWCLRGKLAHLGSHKSAKLIKATAMTLALAAGAFLVINSIVPIEILVAPAVLLCGYFLFSIYKNADEHSVKIFIKLMYFPMLISVVFFALYLQLYSSVTVFILHDVNTNIMGRNIPITWLTSIEPAFIVLLAPVSNKILSHLGSKGLTLQPLNKIFVGILATAISFFLLAIAAYVNNPANHVFLFPYMLANVFLAISELYTIPVSILWISANAPPHVKSILTGVYYFSIAMSGVLSSIIAKASPTKDATDITFAHFYAYVACGTLIFGLLMLLPKKIIKG